MSHQEQLQKNISALNHILVSLEDLHSYEEKLCVLNALPIVQEFFAHANPLEKFLTKLSPKAEFVMKSVIAIAQGPIIFNFKNVHTNSSGLFIQLLEQLLVIELFYQHIGGIIGYHLTVLTLICGQEAKQNSTQQTVHFIRPEGIHIENQDANIPEAVRWGIESIKNMAMIYPLGGAGDRLNLLDPSTDKPLPAAMLPFLGRTLLEGLIRDVQALEYLFYKVHGKQLCTPIAIMTSVEKNNHSHVLEICKTSHWFGRPSNSFYFFIQPMVPVLTIDGDWSLSAPLELALKPSGHGVIWKLANDNGVFDWMEAQGRQHVLIRQINNPLAGIDNSILTLLGKGIHHQKAFGFVSCERLLNSDEGMNVLLERQNKELYEYCISNIEYTNLSRYGISEIPAQPGSSFSFYPANTNILFANISTIRQIVRLDPIPGQLINMKSTVSFIDINGEQSFKPGGRLESTMQNIADYIVDSFPSPIRKEDYKNKLRTFIVYNKRTKTISTTKKSYKKGESLASTPEQAFYDLLHNHYTLLLLCTFALPEWLPIDEYIQKGPSFIFLFHPALGPLYSIICQKIRKGIFSFGSELQLEIAEVDIENISLTGSLLIESKSPLGTFETNGLLSYGNESRCTLRHVIIHNKGIDREATEDYWKNTPIRNEAVKIILHEGAEFYAEGITLQGTHQFEVLPYHRLILHSLPDGTWKAEETLIEKPSWWWKVSFDAHNHIQLTKCFNQE